MPKYKVVFPLLYAGKQYQVGDTVEFNEETGDFLAGPIGPGGVAYLEKAEKKQTQKKVTTKKQKENE